MVGELQREIRQRKLPVNAHLGDGMNLPFNDDAFDAGFSMFGLMFFPDRHRGFLELLRVVKPGGLVVVSSWAPMDQNVLFETFGEAMRRADPTSDEPAPVLPLATVEQCFAEMSQAGFKNVETIHETTVTESATPDILVEAFGKTNIGLASKKRSLGNAWPDYAKRLAEQLRQTLGPTAQSHALTANLTVGMVP